MAHEKRRNQFLSESSQSKDVIKVPVIIKTDNVGSLGAIMSSLQYINASDAEGISTVDVVFSGIGDVTSSDVDTAHESKATIFAFNVKIPSSIQKQISGIAVDVKNSNIIYNMLNQVNELLQSKLFIPVPGQLLGKGSIKQIFNLNKLGKVAGTEITTGLIRIKGSKVRIMRGNRNCIYTGTIKSLNIGKQAVEEVKEGSDCGISFYDFDNYAEGDVIECFTTSVIK
jgi:translation initiation factor IF-2